jgi:ABC-2 type transport system ATP-binding protein
MPDPVVSLHDLSKRFGDFTAVDRVTFDVKVGEIFGFLGANGAGKSTTIRMLCGILRPSSGRGIVGGIDILESPEAVKPFLGYMSQKFSLYDGLTVIENLDFFAGIYRVPNHREAVETALENSGLRAMRGKLTGALPAGWKQQLSLAASVMHKPRILFLDEPTSGVDPMTRRRFWQTIRDMADAGKTVFVTTHSMTEAEYCDRLAIMKAGKLIALGSPNDLKRSASVDTLGDVFLALVRDGA